MYSGLKINIDFNITTKKMELKECWVNTDDGEKMPIPVQIKQPLLEMCNSFIKTLSRQSEYFSFANYYIEIYKGRKNYIIHVMASEGQYEEKVDCKAKFTPEEFTKFINDLTLLNTEDLPNIMKEV